VPRRINQIVNRLLLLGAVDKRTRIDGVMLSQVLSELAEDGTLSLLRQTNKPSAASQSAARPAARLQDNGFASNVEPSDIAAFAQIEAALAERDAQIAELQQAILELANANDAGLGQRDQASGDSCAEVRDRVNALESRMIEQDRTIRHTLTMLIEWIEAGDAQRVAA
jgi:general secretion pathway protein A